MPFVRCWLLFLLVLIYSGAAVSLKAGVTVIQNEHLQSSEIFAGQGHGFLPPARTAKHAIILDEKVIF